jgi:antitoxin VapB
MDRAKVFMTGRSQAVRLPKAYRFETHEVSIEKLPDGAVLLRPVPKQGLGERLWEALGPEALPGFERPAQGAHERDSAWWDAQGFARPVKRSARARKSKTARR